VILRGPVPKNDIAEATSQMRKMKSSNTLLLVGLLTIIGFILVGVFDESVSGRQTFFKVYFAVIFLFAGYAIFMAFQGSSKK